MLGNQLKQYIGTRTEPIYHKDQGRTKKRVLGSFPKPLDPPPPLTHLGIFRSPFWSA